MLIPPDAGKRRGAQLGWDRGRYPFMRRVLETDLEPPRGEGPSRGVTAFSLKRERSAPQPALPLSAIAISCATALLARNPASPKWAMDAPMDRPSRAGYPEFASA